MISSAAIGIAAKAKKEAGETGTAEALEKPDEIETDPKAEEGPGAPIRREMSTEARVEVGESLLLAII